MKGKALFEITGQINRRDFDLTTNSYTQTAGLALGQDIKLIANLGSRFNPYNVKFM
jgi:hypothetical protein